MSIGGNRSPYRANCGYTADDDERFFLGAPWQHYLAAETSITRYKNTTTVPDYRDPSCDGYTGTPMAPYARPSQFWTPCSPDCCGTSDCDIPCGPWPEPVAANTYALYDPASTLDLATCRKVGFKIVYARKIWHGVFGFNDRSNDLICTYDADAGCCHHDVVTGFPTTKYRTITWSGSSNQPSPVVTNFSTSGSCTVDRYSGKLSGSFNEHFDQSSTDFPLNIEDVTICKLFQSLYLDGAWTGPLADFLNGVSGDYTFSVLTQTNTEIHITGEQSDGFTFTANLVLSDPYTSDDVNDDVDALLDEWDLSNDTQLPWRFDTLCTSGPYLNYFEIAQTPFVKCGDGPMPPDTFTSGSYSNTDSDGITTAFTFDPATSGDFEGFGPCTADWYGPIVDNNPQDGSIIGAPNPAGYDPFFDFRFEIWEQTSDGDCDTCWQIFEYGDYAPTWAPYATQWTNLQDASALLPCAFRQYGTLKNGLLCCGDASNYGGGLIGSKYAEVILLSQPSHNFARPCGSKDAATIDQTAILCTTDPPAGALRWPDAANPCPAPPDTGGNWNDNYPKGDWCLVEWTFNYRDVGENNRLRTVATDPLIEYDVCEYDAGLPILRPVTGPWSGISCTQECSQFLPCCPAVVYISNNGESSANSQTFTIPKLSIDETYGSRWQMAPFQWMTDPLWQAPQPPCDLPDGVLWTEDDGSGQSDSDTNWYYAQQPFEECLCSSPGGATALAAGFIGTLSVDDINADPETTFTQIGDSAEALVISDGSAIGKTFQYPAGGQCYMPWWVWAINRYANIQASGRFSCQYADPLAVCEGDVELIPPP